MRASTFALLGLGLALTACRPAPDDGDDGNDDGGSTDGGSADGGSADGGSTDGGSTDGGSGDGGSGDCGDPSDLGSWYGILDAGQVTTAGYDFDANVDDLVAADPGSGNTATVDILIDGAVITNLGYPETMNFWFQDANAAVRTYGTEVGTIATGDKVKFRVTELKNYNGMLEITALTDFEILSSGTPVQVTEAHGQALSYASMAAKNVHVWGTITEEQGSCGGSALCYVLDNGGQDVRIRVSEMVEIYQGECFEFVAPVGYFDPDTQLDLENFDWQRLYY